MMTAANEALVCGKSRCPEIVRGRNGPLAKPAAFWSLVCRTATRTLSQTPALQQHAADTARAWGSA